MTLRRLCNNEFDIVIFVVVVWIFLVKCLNNNWMEFYEISYWHL